jgi:hypothetical protein
MSNIRSLRDVPSIKLQTKTLIVNGVIHRKDSWKDTYGNEYEKVNGKYQLLKNPKVTQDDNDEFTIMICCCIICVLTIVFLLGMSVGSIKMKRIQNVEKNVRN